MGGEFVQVRPMETRYLGKLTEELHGGLIEFLPNPWLALLAVF